MFLLHVLLVTTVIFWMSALMAEAVLTSDEESRLCAAARVGLGYLVMILWFAAAWKYVTIGSAWLIGLALFFIHVVGRFGRNTSQIKTVARATVKKYRSLFVFHLLAVNLFLVPLHIGQTYGPFTEGGGDVTVYADFAKYFNDHNLPVYGLKDAIYDIKKIVANPLGHSGFNLESARSIDVDKGNPPNADYTAYVHSKFQKYSSAQFAPFGQWFFLAGSTNYAVFFGVLAFQYALMLSCVWGFFRSCGMVPATVATFITAASHGLVSVSYNVYYLQAASITFCVLAVAAIRHIRLFSRPGIRIYGLLAAFPIMAYLHFTAIIFPLLLVALKAPWDKDEAERMEKATPDDSNAQTISNPGKAGGWKKLSRVSSVLAITIILSAATIDMFTGLSAYTGLIKSAVNRVMGKKSAVDTHKEIKTYFGTPAGINSTRWMSFVFGSHSQQHYPPYIRENKIADSGARWIGKLGPISIIMGALAWLVVFVVSRFRPMDRATERRSLFLFTVYMVMAAVIVFHHAITQGYLYTQAKGAQNVLAILYIFMTIPLAALMIQRQTALKLYSIPFALVLIAFGGALLAPRFVFASQLAHGLGRGTIMEPSFYSEAERIRKEDRRAFVLFEPRKSADLYLSVQPFMGGRMVPARHLFMNLNTVDISNGELKWKSEPRIATEFISKDDVAHMWVLSAGKTGREDSFVGPYFRYKWRAERLSEKRGPVVIFAGNNYEAFHSKRNGPGGESDAGIYSYLRNGAVSIYVPAGQAHSARVTLTPKKHSEFELMAKATRKILANDENLSVSVGEESPPYMVLNYMISPGSIPRLITLARFTGEFWASIRIDGKEMTGRPDADDLLRGR